MLNYRQIDEKYYLSGGWVDVPEDALFLRSQSIKAVLDLQFTPDSYFVRHSDFVREALNKVGIEYAFIPMNDGENANLELLFEFTHNILDEWESKFKKRYDRVLIKCGVGISRSVAVLANHLCIRDSLSYREAKAKIAAQDRYNYGGMPIGPAIEFELYLKTAFPEGGSAFGEKI